MYIPGTRLILSLMVVALPGTASRQPVAVSIDVKPGDTATTLEANREGMVPVAILSTAQFDASSVDPVTIRIGPAGTEAEPVRTMSEDINNDERLDLLALVRFQDMKLTCDDKVIRLKAKTRSGTDIDGSEAVTVTCEQSGKVGITARWLPPARSAGPGSSDIPRANRLATPAPARWRE